MLFPKLRASSSTAIIRYISVMAMIAGLGFIASFVIFIPLGPRWHLIIIRALDLITIVVPSCPSSYTDNRPRTLPCRA